LEVLQALDWANILGGAAVSAVVGLATWMGKGLWATYVASQDLPYRISGRWYSAEYDEKGSPPHDQRNTFLEVRVARRLHGKIVIKALRSVNASSDLVQTRWKVRSRLVQGDTIVGTWRSTVKFTSRHGVAMLKFIDHGRAVGYWAGPAGLDYPAYGYWIMAKSEADLRRVATSALRETNFECVDVAGFVVSFPPPTKQDGTDNPEVVAREGAA